MAEAPTRPTLEIGRGVSLVAYPFLELGATLLIEGAVLFAFVRRSRNKGEALLGSVAMNLVSHPLATMAIACGTSWSVVEISVIAFEILAWRLACGLPWRKAIALGAFTNVASAGAGVLLNGSRSLTA